MAEPQIRFQDGAGYERMMGVWSRSVGEIFLDWLALPPELRWLDVGCGNGAFTELIADRCTPSEVQGIDPSEGQLAFARTRPAAQVAKFHQGDAMALPFADDTFDVATMALVIFFVPEPPKGVAEMARVVAPGGTVASYTWDIFGDGFPLDRIGNQLRAMGFSPPMPPSADASRMDRLRELWSSAGLESIDTKVIKVQRVFPNFDDYWSTTASGPSLSQTIANMSAEDVETAKQRVRDLLSVDAAGRVSDIAHANAIKGRVPK